MRSLYSTEVPSVVTITRIGHIVSRCCGAPGPNTCKTDGIVITWYAMLHVMLSQTHCASGRDVHKEHTTSNSYLKLPHSSVEHQNLKKTFESLFFVCKVEAILQNIRPPWFSSPNLAISSGGIQRPQQHTVTAAATAKVWAKSTVKRGKGSNPTSLGSWPCSTSWHHYIMTSNSNPIGTGMTWDCWDVLSAPSVDLSEEIRILVIFSRDKNKRQEMKRQ